MELAKAAAETKALELSLSVNGEGGKDSPWPKLSSRYEGVLLRDGSVIRGIGRGRGRGGQLRDRKPAGPRSSSESSDSSDEDALTPLPPNVVNAFTIYLFYFRSVRSLV